MKISTLAKGCLIALCLTLCVLGLVACGQRTDTPENAGLSGVDAPRAVELSTTGKAASGFTVSNAFSSDMVIQRDESIRVWGWADESYNGQTVTATFAGKTAEGKVENGEWLVTFDEGFAVSVALGNNMTVRCGSNEIVFEDVLVGDVYMVIGQSNVAYAMSAHCAAKGKAIGDYVDADAPIRLYYNTLQDTAGYPARGTEEVCEDVVNGRGWWLPTSSNVSRITAVGYLFALDIVEKTELNIPVGIIEIDGNGQPIGAFMPNEQAGATNSDTYNSASGIFVPPGANGTHARYMYNHYMYPYENYALAGVVWYQGESDFQTVDTYVDKFVALMEHMRSTHNLKNKDFPVYIVEFPSIYNQPDDFTGELFATMDLGYIRAEMGSIPQRLSNSYIAVSSDIFDDNYFWNNLHPDIKEEQAARLADLAGSVWYGLTPLEQATGPILKEYSISSDRKTVTLTFDNVGDGLKTSDGGTTVKGFAAISRTGLLSTTVTLTATITAPDQITITAKTSLYGVAYNCVMDNFYGEEINLCNSYGKIASAFTYSEARIEQIRHELVGEGAEKNSLTAEDTLAIHFRTTSGAMAVGAQIRKVTGESASITLSLYKFTTDYATSVAADPVVTKTFASNLDDFSWVELEIDRNQTWGAGEYLLVISNANNIGVQLGDAHEGQVIYRNGEYTDGASVMMGVTYKNRVETVYDIPVDPNTTPEESETAPESTDAESLPITDAESAESTGSESVDATVDSQTGEDSEAETRASDESGCASMLGGAAVMAVLAVGCFGIALPRRRD